MKYQMRIEHDGNYASLQFTRKNSQADKIDLGFVENGALADRVLGRLYDFHQCDDEFEPDDEMVVAEVGAFKVWGHIHVIPADDETRLAVRGVTRENPYRIAYEGEDGNSSRQFPSLAAAAAYVRERWQGVDYVDGSCAFHTDYGSYSTFGFKLEDVGTFEGDREDRNFKFKEFEKGEK